VEPVREVERERGPDNDPEDDVVHRPSRFLIITPSRMLAARSVESMASSRRSKMSFQRMTIIGSIPCSNSDASARGPCGRLRSRAG
jgi:hypothetical protein